MPNAIAYLDESTGSGWGRTLYAFFAEMGRRSVSLRTVQSYSRVLQHFFGRGGKTLDEVTSQDVFVWAYGTGLSGKQPGSITIGARLACLNSFYRCLSRMMVVGSNMACQQQPSGREVNRRRHNMAERTQAHSVSLFEAGQVSLYSTTVDLRSLAIALTVDLCLVGRLAHSRLTPGFSSDPARVSDLLATSEPSYAFIQIHDDAGGSWRSLSTGPAGQGMPSWG